MLAACRLAVPPAPTFYSDRCGDFQFDACLGQPGQLAVELALGISRKNLWEKMRKLDIQSAARESG
ncbi:MAG: hypothetical protein Q8N07_06670 [Rhodocyclaceae bacterium]|nr:hypothetical protein [Rhodocyclaceae bacterium]